MLKDYIERDVVELFTDNSGSRFVHFMGFGYAAEDDVTHPFRFLEFVRNIIPLDAFCEDSGRSSDDYNEAYNAGHHCYIEDCTENRIEEIYEKGFGKVPEPISRKTARTLPNGFYLWDSKAEERGNNYGRN